MYPGTGRKGLVGEGLAPRRFDPLPGRRAVLLCIPGEVFMGVSFAREGIRAFLPEELSPVLAIRSQMLFRSSKGEPRPRAPGMSATTGDFGTSGTISACCSAAAMRIISITVITPLLPAPTTPLPSTHGSSSSSLAVTRSAGSICSSRPIVRLTESSTLFHIRSSKDSFVLLMQPNWLSSALCRLKGKLPDNLQANHAGPATFVGARVSCPSR